MWTTLVRCPCNGGARERERASKRERAREREREREKERETERERARERERVKLGAIVPHAIAEQTWHMKDSQGQILALAFRSKS